ncbi:MAG: hypothetical protein GXY85_03425 [Candidatus Brocadiaceae bacterium]|nr:hypothetical protein [Candidatus Brocadiaceae bacterium]
MPHEADTAQAHGLAWRIVPGFAPTLSRVDLERARRPDALSAQERVKDNTVRSVVRLPDPDRPDGPGLYVKRYKFRSRTERLRHLLLPTKPHVEWRACRLLRRAGIPTCDVLAIAVRRRHGLPQEGFLISREVADAVSLAAYLRTRPPAAPEADELVAELADITVRLARAGLYHDDYHTGNLLIRPAAPPGERLFVVDQHSIHRRRPTPRRMLDMLSMLTRSSGLPGASAEDARPLLRAVVHRWTGQSEPPEGLVDGWAGGLSRIQRRQHRTHMRSRTRRCLKESSLFTTDRADGFGIHRRRDFDLQAVLDAVRRHGEAVRGARPDARVQRTGRRTEVTIVPGDRVPPFDVSRPAAPELRRQGPVCVKSFRRDSLGERLKDAGRLRGRARAMWVAARGFAVRGIPSVRPLALLESRYALSGAPDYVVMEAPDADGTLCELAASEALDAAARRRLSEAVAGLLNRLADEEVYHRDTKPTNVLVRREGNGFRLWLVDLDRVRFDRPLTHGLWVKCLARLNAGIPGRVGLLDRMRCLRLCGRGRWAAAERLSIAREVYALSLTRSVAWKT